MSSILFFQYGHKTEKKEALLYPSREEDSTILIIDSSVSCIRSVDDNSGSIQVINSPISVHCTKAYVTISLSRPYFKAVGGIQSYALLTSFEKFRRVGNTTMSEILGRARPVTEVPLRTSIAG